MIRDGQECLAYLGVGVADPAGVADPTGNVTLTGDGATEAAGTGVAAGSAGASDCSSDRVPVTAGNDNVNAISMKAAAAPIVIFDKTLAVPRGPKAVLDTLLENRSPAPDLPGCKSITTINITHDSMNNPYKT